MKTLQQIKQEIQDCIDVRNKESEYASHSDFEKAKKKAQLRVKFLTPIMQYLEKEPSADFIGKMKQDLERKVESLNSQRSSWAGWDRKKDFSENVSAFEREMGLTTMRKQLKHLNYILS